MRRSDKKPFQVRRKQKINIWIKKNEKKNRKRFSATLLEPWIYKKTNELNVNQWSFFIQEKCWKQETLFTFFLCWESLLSKYLYSKGKNNMFIWLYEFRVIQLRDASDKKINIKYFILWECWMKIGFGCHKKKKLKLSFIWKPGTFQRNLLKRWLLS